MSAFAHCACKPAPAKPWRQERANCAWWCSPAASTPKWPGNAMPAWAGATASSRNAHPTPLTYPPGGRRLTLPAARAAEVALCSAPCPGGNKPVRRIDGPGMRRSTRGAGSNLRHVCDILMGDNPAAERLLVVEVIPPAGHSSSYPPHKHDDDAPGETRLEETYYHRLDPPQRLAFQRGYTSHPRMA